MILRVDLCHSKSILSPRLTDSPHVQMEATNKLQTGTETEKTLNACRVGKCIYRIQGGKHVFCFNHWNHETFTHQLKVHWIVLFHPPSSCLWKVYRSIQFFINFQGDFFNVTKFQVSRLELTPAGERPFRGFVDQGWKPWCVSLRISSCSFGSCPMSCSFRIFMAKGKENSELKTPMFFPNIFLKAWNSGFLELYSNFARLIYCHRKKKHAQILKGRFTLQLKQNERQKRGNTGLQDAEICKVTVATRFKIFQASIPFIELIERGVYYIGFLGVSKDSQQNAGCQCFQNYIVSQKRHLVSQELQNPTNLKHFCALLAITLSILAARQWFILDLLRISEPSTVV